MMKKKSYITFHDALKGQAPQAFATMVKPMGSACNLNCAYCYYLDKAPTIYHDHEPLMPPDVLEEYIKQYIEANEVPEVTFVWHGGEPTDGRTGLLPQGCGTFSVSMQVERLSLTHCRPMVS